MKSMVPASLSLKTAGLLTVLGSAILFSHPATAAPLATDSFATTTDGSGGTYSTATTDSRIYGQNPTASNSGFDAAWSNGTPISTGAIRVETSGLTHSLLQGSAAAGDVYGSSGNSGNPRTVTRELNNTVDSAFSTQEGAGGEIWFSALTTVNATSAGGTFLGLGDNVRHDARQTTGIQVFTGGGLIRLYNGTTELTSVASNRFTVTLGLTYLVAIKVDFSTEAASDSVTMQIYSPSAPYNTPTHTFTASGLTLTASDFGYLGINSNTSNYTGGNAATPRFDEFRLGLTQGDVMVVPEPGTVALVGIGLGVALFGRRRRLA